MFFFKLIYLTSLPFISFCVSFFLCWAPSSAPCEINKKSSRWKRSLYNIPVEPLSTSRHSWVYFFIVWRIIKGGTEDKKRRDTLLEILLWLCPEDIMREFSIFFSRDLFFASSPNPVPILLAEYPLHGSQTSINRQFCLFDPNLYSRWA